MGKRTDGKNITPYKNSWADTISRNKSFKQGEKEHEHKKSQCKITYR